MARDVWAVVCVAVACPWAAQAQTYPARAIRISMPFPAGGTADPMPRNVAEKSSVRWGRPVVIDNRAGAVANIGVEMACAAEHDGYTLPSARPLLVIDSSLYPEPAFDPARFVLVSVMAAVPKGCRCIPSWLRIACVNRSRGQRRSCSVRRYTGRRTRRDVVRSANVRID